jgi:hypothetical protein
MMGGPNFETPAELRMLKFQGVDAVGKILNWNWPGTRYRCLTGDDLEVVWAKFFCFV